MKEPKLEELIDETLSEVFPAIPAAVAGVMPGAAALGGAVAGTALGRAAADYASGGREDVGDFVDIDKTIVLPDGTQVKVPLMPGETTSHPAFKKRVRSMMRDRAMAKKPISRRELDLEEHINKKNIKISRKKLQKIIEEEIDILRDEMILNEASTESMLQNPLVSLTGAGLEYLDRKTGGFSRLPGTPVAQRPQRPNLGGYVNCNQGDGPPDIRPVGTCPQDQPKPDILPGEGEVRVKSGQGYYHLARTLGLNPRDKEIRGVLRQLVAEKSPRGRSTLFTGRDYSWLRQHFNSKGQPRKTVGALGSPTVAASAGPAAGMTRQEIGGSQQAIKDIGAGDESGQTLKKAAAIDADYSRFTQFMTPDEIERLTAFANRDPSQDKVQPGEGNLYKQLKSDESAAKSRRKEMINHAKDRVSKLANSYGGVTLSSGAISMLVKRAGVLPDGSPNFRALEQAIHGSLNRKQSRKTGQTGPI